VGEHWLLRVLECGGPHADGEEHSEEQESQRYEWVNSTHVVEDGTVVGCAPDHCSHVVSFLWAAEMMKVSGLENMVKRDGLYCDCLHQIYRYEQYCLIGQYCSLSNLVPTIDFHPLLNPEYSHKLSNLLFNRLDGRPNAQLDLFESD